jgi:hypothetical protein
MYIRLRNRNLRYRRLGKYLGRLFFGMWRSSRPQPPDCREVSRASYPENHPLYIRSQLPRARAETAPSSLGRFNINRMFRRLDSNQNNESQSLAGCQLPYAGLMRQIGLLRTDNITIPTARPMPRVSACGRHMGRSARRPRCLLASVGSPMPAMTAIAQPSICRYRSTLRRTSTRRQPW